MPRTIHIYSYLLLSDFQVTFKQFIKIDSNNAKKSLEIFFYKNSSAKYYQKKVSKESL